MMFAARGRDEPAYLTVKCGDIRSEDNIVSDPYAGFSAL